MKNILFFVLALLVLLSGCAAPAEQIVEIYADSTPLPAVTPLLTPALSEGTAAESVPSPSAMPANTAASSLGPTTKPTEAPAPTPTVQPTMAPPPTAIPATEPTYEPTAEPAKSESSSDFGGSVLALVNSYRSSAGLSSLKYSSAMQKAADTRAMECASSFSHTRPDGSKAYTALTERGISFTAFGENIFAASGMSSVSAEYVVEQWMASQGHRENILRDSFTHMCIGVASQGDEIYVVQLFGAGIS